MKNKHELIADIFEAMEKAKRWAPLYRAVLKETGSKEQARNAVLWADKVETRLALEGKNRKAS